MRNLHLIVIALVSTSFVGQAYAAVPGQFIAKMYSETLGRAPEPGGWQSYVTHFQNAGCSQGSLRTAGSSFYSSTEYQSRGFDNVEKVLTAYRGILSREPDANGFNYWVSYLDTGHSFDTVVAAFFNSTEFRRMVGRICTGKYGWGSALPLGPPHIPTTSSGFQGGTAAQLQALLNSAPPGGSVYLAQRAVVWADRQIVIPAGKMLATRGSPDRYHFPRMGRIVRTALFDSPLVRLEPGAKIASVWVSGQRPRVGYVTGAANIFVRSGTGGSVTHCRTDSPAGWSTLMLHGRREQGIGCANVTIASNLSTGYSSHHTNAEGGGWSDGVSNACEDADVFDNHIVDPTDVGIVLFRADPATQTSQITDNTIIAAGESAYGAIAIDPLRHGDPPSFAGSFVGYNRFWSSPTAHFDIGLAIGTMPWFANVGGVVGSGAKVQNNTTANILTNMDAGITIDGMLGATVQGNGLLRRAVEVSACPSGNVLADVAGGHASGNLQAWRQATAHSCIGH